jgi:Xaa-Pro dipeptidase
LEEKGAKGAFITSCADIYYLSGAKTAESLFIPLDGDPVLLCLKNMGCEEVKKRTWIENVMVDEGWCTPPTKRENLPNYIEETIDILAPWKFMMKMIKEHGLNKSKIGLDPYVQGFADEVNKKFSETSFFGLEDELSKMRSIKSDIEVSNIKKAVEITEKTMETMWSAVEEGVTERNLAATAYKTMIDLGANGLADEVMGDFWGPIVVASGPNSANPHHLAGDRKIRRGDFLKIDMGARYNGYNADITRTVVFGKPSERQCRMHEILLEAQETTIAGLSPGEETHDALWPGWEVLFKSQYGDYGVVPMGHGIGLNVWELPNLELSLPSEKMLAGWVTTIEPGLYIPGLGGVRIEDDILISKEGHEYLSTLDRSIDAIKKCG